MSEVEHCRLLAHQRGLAFEEALAYLAIGMYYTRTVNDYEQALVRFELSLQLLRPLDDRYFLAEVLARYGICRGTPAMSRRSISIAAKAARSPARMRITSAF